MEFAGFVFLDKPPGITSANLLNRLKRRLPKKIKVGHAGTLDSFARGLLVVGISRAATRLLPYIMHLDKRYAVTAQLGIVTDTLDITGVVLQQKKVNIIPDELVAALHSFVPCYLQKPPFFSAKKYQGSRLSDLARSGKGIDQLTHIVQKKAKQVHVSQFDNIQIHIPEFSFEVTVSHGAYIRSLVYDLGEKLGSGAVTKGLIRTTIGPWSISDAYSLQTLDLEEHLISIDSVCAKLPKK